MSDENQPNGAPPLRPGPQLNIQVNVRPTPGVPVGAGIVRTEIAVGPSIHAFDLPTPLAIQIAEEWLRRLKASQSSIVVVAGGKLPPGARGS